MVRRSSGRRSGLHPVFRQPGGSLQRLSSGELRAERRMRLQHVVEADGSVYPCDFYVLDAYRLGNILTEDFQELDQSPRLRTFVEDSLRRPEECESCSWLPFCGGGCRREPGSGSGQGGIPFRLLLRLPPLSPLCPAPAAPVDPAAVMDRTAASACRGQRTGRIAFVCR